MSTIDPKAFVGRQLKVELKNSATLDGILTVIDPYGNMLLGNVTETSNDIVDGSIHQRKVGLVSVKRSSVKRVLMGSKDYENLNLNV